MSKGCVDFRHWVVPHKFTPDESGVDAGGLGRAIVSVFQDGAVFA